jgi:hypothetical protein
MPSNVSLSVHSKSNDYKNWRNIMDKTKNMSKSSQNDPVRWLVGTTATGIAAAMTFLGTAIVAL